jgi:uncharacterized small protein (DUF1192 family)
MGYVVFAVIILMYLRSFSQVLKRNTMPLEYAKEKRIEDTAGYSDKNEANGTISFFTLGNYFKLTAIYGTLFSINFFLSGMEWWLPCAFLGFWIAGMLPGVRHLVVSFKRDLVSEFKRIISDENKFKEDMRGVVDWDLARLDKEIAELNEEIVLLEAEKEKKVTEKSRREIIDMPRSPKNIVRRESEHPNPKRK